MMAGVTIAVALTTLNMCVLYIILLCFGSILSSYGDVDVFDLKNALNLSLNDPMSVELQKQFWFLN